MRRSDSFIGACHRACLAQRPSRPPPSIKQEYTPLLSDDRSTTLSAMALPAAPNHPATADFLWPSGVVAFRPASFSLPAPSDVFRTDSLVSPPLTLPHISIRFRFLPEKAPASRMRPPRRGGLGPHFFSLASAAGLLGGGSHTTRYKLTTGNRHDHRPSAFSPPLY